MSTITSDRIERRIYLRHPPSKVWRALTNAKEFGQWFGVVFTEPFAPGVRRKGRVTHRGYEHMTMDMAVERMEPERLFSWRWHSGGAEPGESFADEPTTEVVFELQEVPGGTLLTMMESGFEQLQSGRREKAFSENDEGWTLQMEAIEKHLGASP